MKILITLGLAALCSFQGTALGAKPRLLVSPQARDTWRSVRTNHMFVIGNAEPEKLRQVATWLEFFHGAFARLVSRNVLESSVPTTVIIFRDDASFTPFKPLYQGRPGNVSGYFQPGEDVNYIAISLDPNERNPYSTAFHEYVHLHIRDNVPGAPLWLNEGLAELYGSLQFSGTDAQLGVPIYSYLRLLREQELLPLEKFFSIDTSSPHYNEQDKTGVFYGQSWALVHYLMLGNRDRQEQFKRFLQQVSRGENAAKAIEDTYGMSIATLEKELRAYIQTGNLTAQRITNVDNPQSYASYTATQRSSLSEGEANYYLGDLLLHTGREQDAERYFKQAITLDPGFSPAYAALGTMCVYQRRFAEAKKYLQKATTSPQSYLVHYFYAYVLSREGVTPSGQDTEYSRENVALMREQLLSAIKNKSDYAPAYYLLALINLVTDERLDEALQMAQKARQISPAKSGYSLLLAQIHLRRSEENAARPILETLTRDSDSSVRTEAQELLDSLNGKSETSKRPRKTAPAISAALDSEPAASGTSRMLGGDSGGVVIRDGQTIDSSGSLPTVDDILQKYLAALGGANAIKTVNSRMIKGTVDVVGISRGGSFETYAQAPNRMLSVITAHPMGTVKVSFDGRNGWSKSGTVQRALKSAELSAVQRQAEFYAVLTLKNSYAKITMPGMSKIGYRDVYVLDLQPAVGAVERLYLDATTYLPVRINTVQTLGTLTAPVEIYLDDWREVEGIKYPFGMSQRFPKLTLTFTVKEIKHNVPVDARLFEP